MHPCTHCAHVVVLLLAAFLCVRVDSRVPDVTDYHEDTYHPELQYRDDTEPAPSDVEKPVREDGLGSLLLKNLRFRDLESRQVQPLAWLLSLHKPKQTQAAFGNNRNKVNEIAREVSKRQDVSVSQLAKLLNTLKTRNADDSGVKLQSLRFGK